jgi:hypothetical protein
MNAAKTTFGAFLVASAFAAIAAFHHEFWPSAQSPPQQIKTVQETDTAVQPEAKDTAVQSEPETPDFADSAKTVHTIPFRRKRAPSQELPVTAQPTPGPSAARVTDNPPDLATSPPHAAQLDICARNGGHRVDFMRGRHASWRCVYPRRR